MTNQHKRGHLNWPRSLHIPHKSAQVSNGCPLFFFAFYIFFTSVLRDFEKFWEILRDFEKFWEIFTSPSNTTFQLQWFPCLWFWEILRDFEKFWENSSQFFLVLFSRFDLLPHGIAGICCDNGWSHMQSVSYLLVVLQLLPRLDSWRHCTMKRRHLWQFHCASLTMFAVSLALYCIRTGKLLQIQFYDGWPCLYQPTYVQLHHPSHFDMCPQVEWRIAEYTSCTETLNWTHVSWMWFCNILRFGPMCPKSTIISANNHKLFT